MSEPCFDPDNGGVEIVGAVDRLVKALDKLTKRIDGEGREEKAQRIAELECELAEAKRTIDEFEESFGGDVMLDKVELHGLTISQWRERCLKAEQELERTRHEEGVLHERCSELTATNNGLSCEKEKLECELAEAREMSKGIVCSADSQWKARRWEEKYNTLRAKAQAVVGTQYYSQCDLPIADTSKADKYAWYTHVKVGPLDDLKVELAESEEESDGE